MTVDRRISFSPAVVEQAATPFAQSERIRTSENVRAAINPHDAEYHRLLRHVLEFGSLSGDRTGTGTQKEFGYQMRFDLSHSFPLLTTKNTWWNGIEKELLWFLQGGTNIRYLTENGVHIWDEWADENGELGPVYGKQWIGWPDKDGKPINQIQEVQSAIINNPNSRRHIVSAWNVAEIDNMALPPCHLLFQFQVAEGKLNSQLYQRSGDVFLGVPFNIASYALLTHMMAQTTGLEPGTFIHTLGDVHAYNNHRDQIQIQLSRPSFPPPQLVMDSSVKDIFDFRSEHYQVINYQHHATIKAPIAV